MEITVSSAFLLFRESLTVFADGDPNFAFVIRRVHIAVPVRLHVQLVRGGIAGGREKFGDDLLPKGLNRVGHRAYAFEYRPRPRGNHAFAQPLRHGRILFASRCNRIVEFVRAVFGRIADAENEGFVARVFQKRVQRTVFPAFRPECGNA